MKIENLCKHPDAIAALANWHYKEWHHLYPGESAQDFVDELEKSLLDEAVPSTWVLVDGQGIWGSASVIEQDMSTNTHLGPWLASVYIHPDKRGRGLGKQLIREVIRECRRNGLRELFLFTPGQEYFYQTLGWTALKREKYHGEDISVMTLRLRD